MKPTLTELAEKYHSDKLYNHSYIPFYESLFAEMDISRVLELGIGYESLMRPFLPPDVSYLHGSSLLLWQEYFEDAHIFGTDIRPDTMILDQERIETFIVDQAKATNLWWLRDHLGWTDIILDDGSHQAEHQILTAAVLLPMLADGGIYIVEDCQEPERVQNAIGGEIVRFNKRPDDCLVVIRK